MSMLSTPASAEGGVPAPGLLGSVLSGLLARPAPREELGEPTERPASLELRDHVDQVAIGIGAEDRAVIDERVGDREAFAAADRAGEEVVSTADGEVADSAFDATVVDLEPAVVEATTEKLPLVFRVGRCAPQRGLRQKLGVDFLDPAIQGIQNRQRAPPPLFASSLRGQAAFLAFGFDQIEIREVLERNRSSSVLGEQCCMKLAADVHATTQPSLGGHGDDRLAIVIVLHLARVAGVSVTLDEPVDGGEPVHDLVSLPALSVTVRDALSCSVRADASVRAHEAPKVSAEGAVLGGFVEGLQVRVVDADDLGSE